MFVHFDVTDCNSNSYQAISPKEKPWNVLQPEETSLWIRKKMKCFDAIMKDTGLNMYSPQVQNSPKERCLANLHQNLIFYISPN